METPIYSQFVIGIGITHIPRFWVIIITNILASVILYNHQSTKLYNWIYIGLYIVL